MELELIKIEIREELPVGRQIAEAFNQIFRELHQIRKEIYTMSTTAVTRDQFDAALAALLQAEATRDAAVTTALNDLIAKVGSGGVTTPEDFAAELAQVATLQANAAALTQTATADARKCRHGTHHKGMCHGSRWWRQESSAPWWGQDRSIRAVLVVWNLSLKSSPPMPPDRR